MRIPNQLFIAGREAKNLDLNRIQKTLDQTPMLQVTDYKPLASSGSVLWTSTLVGKTTDWLRFCKYMEDTFGSDYVGNQGVIFEVSSSAKLYRIDSDDAWLALGEKYGKVENAKKFNIVVDWAKVQQDYDGVFHARGAGFWDAESTVWLNPKVLSVKRVVDLDRGCSIPSIKMAEKKNVPTNQELWDKVIKLTKGELKELSHNGKTVQSPNEGKGFTKYPSAYANGWAAKTYKDLGGKWKKESSDHKLPRKFDKAHCESKTCGEMGFSERASCAPYKSCPSPKKASGEHKLPPLPYEYDALEPHISKETLHFHHTKHHQGYVDGLNKAEIGLEKAREGLQNERMISAHTEDIAFNWGGHYLHTLYWRSLTPSAIEMSEQLSNLIEKDFGSIEKFGFNFKEIAKGVKGSGWAVLVLRNSRMGDPKLEILGVKNHEHHILWNSHVLLPIDVWEHAYYLDNQNDRGGHFDKVFDNLIDWNRVEERFTEAMTYQVATQKLAAQKVASIYLAKGKAKKDVGKGGLDEWFSGHGQGKNKNDGKATWGDWVAISPVKRTITKEDGTKKTYEAGDIIGPCGSVSDDANWKDLTNKGKSPLKCMARPKAHKMKKEERAELAKNKMKAEKGNNTQKPTNTPTFKKEKKDKKAMKPNAQRVAYRYLQAGKKDFRIHHRSYTNAMQEAYDFAEKNGYSLIEDDIFQQVTTGKGKPSVGETRKHSLLLMKGDKMQRKALQVQVYGMENGYELNVYIL
jgi:superoxide dismutase